MEGVFTRLYVYSRAQKQQAHISAITTNLHRHTFSQVTRLALLYHQQLRKYCNSFTTDLKEKVGFFCLSKFAAITDVAVCKLADVVLGKRYVSTAVSDPQNFALGLMRCSALSL